MKPMLHVILTVFSVLLMPCLALAQGWYGQNSGTNKSLFDVHFADTQHGWIASMTNSIFHTSDGGNNWVDLSPPPSVNYWAVHFVSILEGFAVGNFGQIRYTNDAGSTWVDQTSGVDGELWDIYFLDENTGWITGGRIEGFPGPDPTRYVLHTSNGGDTWTTQLYETDEYPLHGIAFFNANIGYVVGEAGAIFKTTDGGATWNQQTSGTIRELYSVYATTPDTAWAVGVSGLVLRTIDGGASWDSLYFGTLHHFSHIQFVDPQTGWIAGGDNTHATVLHTTDGGETWEFQNTGTSNFLYSLYFTDPDTGWAVGYDGTIIHTTNGGTGIEEDNDFTTLPTNFILAQNVPNPFSSTTIIRFSLAHAEHVALKIYNIIGQEMEALVDGKLEAGEHNVVFDAHNLPNGVYFYRLNAGDISQTKRCVLLK